MNSYFRRSIIYISLCINFFILLSENLSQNFNIQTYTFKDGLPTQSFYDAVQDTTGRMWFACNKGLTVYDGYEWNFLSVNEGIPMANYIKVEVDAKGRIWALPYLTKSHIVYGDIDNWKTLPPIKLGVNFNSALDFAINLENDFLELAVNTHDSLFYFNGTDWSNETSNFPPGTRFYTIHLSNNVFYYATSKGLFSMDKSLEITEINLRNNQLNQILSLFINKNNPKDEIYILSKNWLGKIEDDSLNIIVSNLNLSSHLEIRYYFLVKDCYQNFYFGNDKSLHRYSRSENKITSLNYYLGQPLIGAMGLFVDREENIWIMSQRGIQKVKSSPLVSFFASDGLLSNEVSVIEENFNGDLVFGHNNGFTFFTGTKFNKKPFRKSFNLLELDSRVLDIKKFNDKLWFTAYRIGFGSVTADNDINWQTHNSPNPFLTLGRFNSDLLILKIDTLLALDGDNFKIRKVFNSKSAIGGREIVEENDSTILIATNGQGVIKIVGEEITFIKSPIDNYNNAYAIFLKDDSTTLVGTIAGLCKISGTTLEKYSLPNLSINSPIYFIESGNKPGSIWFGLDKGVIYWHDNKTRFYDPNSGLAGYETNRHAGFLDSKGNFWIGTDNGVSMFPAGSEDIPNPKPLVDMLYFEDMKFSKYSVNKDVNFTHDQNSFSLHFRCLSFYNESNISFNLKLIDLDGVIHDEFDTKERSARFSNLNPGDYRIILKAQNPLGIYSDDLISSIVTISSPFYTQIWFLVIVVLGFVLIGFIIQRVISQRTYSKVLMAEIKHITEELQNAEKVKLSAIYENIEYDRKRISRDLHDSLGQILTSAKLKLEAFQYSGSVRDEQFEDSLGLLQNTGKVLRMIVHNLHPLEIEKYGLAASIKMICHEVNRDSSIKVSYFEKNYSGRLSKKSEVMVFRIVQEAVNNILKHSNCDELNMRIEENADELTINVKDNGKGFKINGHGLSAEKNNTFGLVNMKQRAELIGAELTITSVLNLGTTINIRIPLNG